jgi:pimeloyl-ACP methyl ester carboxylesterase
MRYIFFHGWGLGPNFWKRFASCLQNKAIEKIYADLGYYGAEYIPNFTKEDIVFCHSIGVFYALDKIQKLKIQPKALIVFSGFTRFTQAEDFSGNSINSLKIMQKAVQRNALHFLNDFTTKCGLKGFVQTMPYQDKLLYDLQWLENGDFRQYLPQLNCSILVFYNYNDPITSYKLIEDCWKNKADMILYKEHYSNYQAHCLPCHKALEIAQDFDHWIDSCQQ